MRPETTLPPPGDPFRPVLHTTLAVPPEPTPSDRPSHTSLADLLRQELSRRGKAGSVELGKELSVSSSTAWHLLSETRVPTESTLARVARFVHLPITEVRRIAARAPGAAERFELPREFDQLDHRQRRVLVEMGWTLLDARAQRVTRS